MIARQDIEPLKYFGHVIGLAAVGFLVGCDAPSIPPSKNNSDGWNAPVFAQMPKVEEDNDADDEPKTEEEVQAREQQDRKDQAAIEKFFLEEFGKPDELAPWFDRIKSWKVEKSKLTIATDLPSRTKAGDYALSEICDIALKYAKDKRDDNQIRHVSVTDKKGERTEGKVPKKKTK